MAHDDSSNIQVPRQLWHDVLLALDQALGRIEALDPDPAIVTRQIYDLGQRVLVEARRLAPPPCSLSRGAVG